MLEDWQILEQGPHHIAVFKPHNLAVVGGFGVPRPTLLDLMRQRFGPQIFAVHRLDRVTAGITLFARSNFAKHALENAFKKRLVKKTYWAIVSQKPEWQKITVDKKLKSQSTGKKSGSPKIQICSTDNSGESALTHFKFIKHLKGDFYLIEAQPISGRMHQIRAHLAYLNLPIVGDALYGSPIKLGKNIIALCAVGLSLPAPKGKAIKLEAVNLFNYNSYI